MPIPQRPQLTTAKARQIVGNPGDYAHMPIALRTRRFTTAWLVAKSAHGHPVLQTRINRPHSGDAA